MPRQREALTIMYVNRPPRATNLDYMTQSEMAASKGVRKQTFLGFIHAGLFELDLSSRPPRASAPEPVRRRLLREVEASGGIWDLCAQLLRPGERLAVDHVVPLARGATHDPDNLRVVHWLCNARDGARRTAEEYEPPPLGYVRRFAPTPSGRGERTWIEVEPPGAAIVRFLFTEFVRGRHSLRSMARALEARAADFGEARVPVLLTRDVRANVTRLHELLWNRRYSAAALPPGAERRRSTPRWSTSGPPSRASTSLSRGGSVSAAQDKRLASLAT